MPSQDGTTRISNTKLAVTIIGGTIGVLRTAFAVYKIIRHRNTFDTLPFISPLLWADWIGLHSTTVKYSRSPVLRSIAPFLGICVFVMCFWITIGYSQLGYGVHQYDVLDISA
jgi:hypothetical protein